MKHRLTDRYLQTVKAPSSGRLVVVDTEVKGLSLRVTPNGNRSFLVRYRPRLQAQRAFTVPGTYPAVSLAGARQRARDIIAAAKRGVDLIAEERRLAGEQQKAASSSRTIRQLAAEYIEKHCKPNHRRWRDMELRLNNHVLPKLGDRPASNIRRGDVVELLDDLQHVKGLRQQVNRTRAALSTMFQYAIEREYVTENPVIGTRARKMETERTRTLTDEELRAIWRALDDLPQLGRSFVRTLMLTAARRDEVRQMQWNEIVSAGGLWVLPAARNKANRDFEVPLSAPMVSLLDELPRLGPYIFTSTGNKPWSQTDKFKHALVLKSGVAGWVYHDIRRTVRSRLAELHISFEIAERVLNHAMTKLERTYNRHAYRQEKAKALQAWADHLLFIVGQGRDAPNVVELRAGA